MKSLAFAAIRALARFFPRANEDACTDGYVNVRCQRCGGRADAFFVDIAEFRCWQHGEATVRGRKRTA